MPTTASFWQAVPLPASFSPLKCSSANCRMTSGRPRSTSSFTHSHPLKGRYPHVCKDHGLRGRKRQTHQGRCTHAVAHWPDHRGRQQQSGQNQCSGCSGMGTGRRPFPPGRCPAGTAPVAPAHLKVRLSNGVVVERKGKNASLTVTDPTGRRSGQQLLNAFVEPLALSCPASGSHRQGESRHPAPSIASARTAHP